MRREVEVEVTVGKEREEEKTQEKRSTRKSLKRTRRDLTKKEKDHIHLQEKTKRIRENNCLLKISRVKEKEMIKEIKKIKSRLEKDLFHQTDHLPFQETKLSEIINDLMNLIIIHVLLNFLF
jgi:hypothetical protein